MLLRPSSSLQLVSCCSFGAVRNNPRRFNTSLAIDTYTDNEDYRSDSQHRPYQLQYPIEYGSPHVSHSTIRAALDGLAQDLISLSRYLSSATAERQLILNRMSN